MTAQSDVDSRGDQEPPSTRWTRLDQVEGAVVQALAVDGVPAIHRHRMHRAGRPALGLQVAEVAVSAATGVANRLGLLDDAEATARQLGKLCAATVRESGGRLVVTMSIEGFAKLARAATDPTLRDQPPTEEWPLGTAPCAECGAEVRLGRQLVPGDGRLAIVCSEQCRTRRTARRKRNT